MSTGCCRPRLVLLAMVLVWSVTPAWGQSAGASPYGRSVTTPVIDELTLLRVLGEAALTSCFLTSIRIDGLETCTISTGGVPIPMICLRVRNNYPSNILEASYKYQHFSVMTVAGQAMLDAMSLPTATPASKTLGRDGDSSSGSYTAMGRTLAMPLMADAVMALATAVSAGTLCHPPILPGAGYLFLSEGDESSAGRSQWRATISPYWLHGVTGPITGLAKSIELVGACGLDFTYFLCYGGYGTVFPGSGQNPAASPAMNLLITAWRAQEIHAPLFPMHGPYGNSLGPLVWQLHHPLSYAFGTGTAIPKYSPGSYVQWLYPGTTGVGVPDGYCYPLGMGAGGVPPIATQMLSESLNRIPLGDQVLSFAYWSRWTCCNYCMSSDQAPDRQLIPERSFRPSLTRRP